MMSLAKLLQEQLLIDYFDLEPFNPGDAGRALRWIKKFKPKLGKVGDRPTYMITDEIIEKANKEAYKIFCARLNKMEKSKKKYDQRSNS